MGAGTRQEAGRMQRGEHVVPAIQVDGGVFGLLSVGVEPDLEDCQRSGGLGLNCSQFLLPAETEDGVTGLGHFGGCSGLLEGSRPPG